MLPREVNKDDAGSKRLVRCHHVIDRSWSTQTRGIGSPARVAIDGNGDPESELALPLLLLQVAAGALYLTLLAMEVSADAMEMRAVSLARAEEESNRPVCSRKRSADLPLSLMPA